MVHGPTRAAGDATRHRSAGVPGHGIAAPACRPRDRSAGPPGHGIAAPARPRARTEALPADVPPPRSASDHARHRPATKRATGQRTKPATGHRPPATYRPGIAPNSSVDPNPSSAPASAVPVARASAATAAATAGATSRLNTDGIT